MIADAQHDGPLQDYHKYCDYTSERKLADACDDLGWTVIEFNIQKSYLWHVVHRLSEAGQEDGKGLWWVGWIPCTFETVGVAPPLENIQNAQGNDELQIGISQICEPTSCWLGILVRILMQW
jgi:hypothetical protein